MGLLLRLCSETVAWVVLAQRITVSEARIAAIARLQTRPCPARSAPQPAISAAVGELKAGAHDRHPLII